MVRFFPAAFKYLEQVRNEVRKVTWPTWDDLRKTTTVIVIVVIILGIIIGIMDFIFAKIFIDYLPRFLG